MKHIILKVSWPVMRNGYEALLMRLHHVLCLWSMCFQQCLQNARLEVLRTSGTIIIVYSLRTSITVSERVGTSLETIQMRWNIRFYNSKIVSQISSLLHLPHFGFQMVVRTQHHCPSSCTHKWTWVFSVMKYILQFHPSIQDNDIQCYEVLGFLIFGVTSSSAIHILP